MGLNFLVISAAFLSTGKAQPRFGWEAVSVTADGKSVSIDVGRDEFNAAFADCPVVQYTRNGEVHSIYKRVSPIPYGFDAYNVFTHTWKSDNNKLHEDFEMYSTYVDLSMNQNEWEFCNYNDPDVGYPRDCGRHRSVGNTWFSFPGGRFDARGLTKGAGFAIHQPYNCPTKVPVQKYVLAIGKLRKGNNVAQIEVRTNYEVSFTLQPRGVMKGWTNIIHVTTKENCCNMGYRIPGVWFHSQSTKLHICTGCKGNGNTCLNPTESLVIGDRTRVTIRVNGGIFTVQYDSREVGRVSCASPFEPSQDQLATVYLSDGWYPAANAVVESVIYSLPTEGHLVSTLSPVSPVQELLTKAKVVKGNNVAQIEVGTNFEFSFTLQPRGVLNGWTNIVHVTMDGNCCNMGYRIPGVWFHSKTTKLHICTGCNGVGNTCLNPIESLQIGTRTRVTIRVNDGVFTAQYDNREVGRVSCTSPFEPSQGRLATVYLSDGWYPAANAVVENVVYSQAKVGTISMGTVDVLKDYELSFTINPKGTKSGWTEILHMSSDGGDCCNVGQRIPGIFFHSETTKLHICTGCGSNGNTCMNPSYSLPLNKDTRVTVRVHLDYFTVYYNGIQANLRMPCVDAYEPNGGVAVLYVSDSNYNLPNAVIRDVTYTAPKICYDCECQMKGREECYISSVTGCCQSDCDIEIKKAESGSYTW